MTTPPSVPSTCSLPLACHARELLTQNPSALSSAAITAGEIFAWYAMPDVVRSRALRVLLKTGLTANFIRRSFFAPEGEATITGPWASTEDPWASSDEDACSSDECAEESDMVDVARSVLENPRKYLPMLATGAGIVTAAALASCAAERWIFRSGERRRARGLRMAHTRLALPLAACAFVADIAIDVALSEVDAQESDVAASSR